MKAVGMVLVINHQAHVNLALWPPTDTDPEGASSTMSTQAPGVVFSAIGPALTLVPSHCCPEYAVTIGVLPLAQALTSPA